MPNATSGQVGQYRLHWILIQPFFIPNNTLTQFYHLQDHKTKKKKKRQKKKRYTGYFVLLPDGLLPLGLADLGLLVPLGHDLSQGGASDGPREFHCTAGTLLCHLFLLKKKIQYIGLLKKIMVFHVHMKNRRQTC